MKVKRALEQPQLVGKSVDNWREIVTEQAQLVPVNASEMEILRWKLPISSQPKLVFNLAGIKPKNQAIPHRIRSMREERKSHLTVSMDEQGRRRAECAGSKEAQPSYKQAVLMGLDQAGFHLNGKRIGLGARFRAIPGQRVQSHSKAHAPLEARVWRPKENRAPIF